MGSDKAKKNTRSTVSGAKGAAAKESSSLEVDWYGGEIIDGESSEAIEELSPEYEPPFHVLCPECGRETVLVHDTKQGINLRCCSALLEPGGECTFAEAVRVVCPECARTMIRIEQSGDQGFYLCSGVTAQQNRCTNTVNIDSYQVPSVPCPHCGRILTCFLSTADYNVLLRCSGVDAAVNRCSATFRTANGSRWVSEVLEYNSITEDDIPF